MGNRDVNININSGGNAEAKILSVQQALKSLSSMSLGTLGGGLLGGATVGGAVAFLKSAAGAAMEAEEQVTKLKQSLQSGGNTTGFSANQLSDYADELQKVTRFEGDATKAAIARLAAYDRISGPTFKRAIASAQDVAEFTGKSLEDAMILVGESLQSPEEGLKKLAKAGISFNDEQKSLIKNLTDSNRLLEAQQEILDAIDRKAGGQARAAGETRSGQVTILKNEFGDLMEDVGALALELGNATGALKLFRDAVGGIRYLLPAAGDRFTPSELDRAARLNMHPSLLGGVGVVAPDLLEKQTRLARVTEAIQSMESRNNFNPRSVAIKALLNGTDVIQTIIDINDEYKKTNSSVSDGIDQLKAKAMKLTAEIQGYQPTKLFDFLSGVRGGVGGGISGAISGTGANINDLFPGLAPRLDWMRGQKAFGQMPDFKGGIEGLKDSKLGLAIQFARQFRSQEQIKEDTLRELEGFRDVLPRGMFEALRKNITDKFALKGDQKDEKFAEYRPPGLIESRSLSLRPTEVDPALKAQIKAADKAEKAEQHLKAIKDKFDRAGRIMLLDL